MMATCVAGLEFLGERASPASLAPLRLSGPTNGSLTRPSPASALLVETGVSMFTTTIPASRALLQTGTRDLRIGRAITMAHQTRSAIICSTRSICLATSLFVLDPRSR